MKRMNLILMLTMALGILFTSCEDVEKGYKDGVADATAATKSVADKAVKKINEAPNKGLKVGDIAPDFSLKNIDGKMVSLADYEAVKGYIITFTCNHCPYAVMYEDRLVALHNAYAPKGYPVIAINPNDPAAKPDDSYENMIVRAKEKGFTFPYVFDEGQKVYPQYGATKTPHVFLLDKDRKVTYIGAIDDSAQDAAAVEVKYVENAIANMDMGKAPDPDFTKAIGCSIKRL